MKQHPKFLILLLGLVSLAAIYKEEDPMGDTPTNPIGYTDKMAEIKQGIKEAPKPSFQLIPKEKFMIDSNLETDKKEELIGEAQPVLGEDLPLEVQHESDNQELLPAQEEGETTGESDQTDSYEQDQDGLPVEEEELSQDTTTSSSEEEEAPQDDWWSTEESSDASSTDEPEQ